MEMFLSAYSIGELNKDDFNKWNEIEYEIEANLDNKKVYEKGYEVFRDLYEILNL